MRPRIGYKKLIAVGAAAVIGVGSTIALTSGSASASPVFGYSGYAHGTYVQTGLANSGPQVSSVLGCVTEVGATSRNNLATANVNNQAIARSVKTETFSHDTSTRGNGVTSVATAVDVKLGNLLSITGLRTSTSAYYKNGGFGANSGTSFASVRIGNVNVPSLLKPGYNTKVAVPGIGYMILNRVGSVKTSNGIYSYAQGITIHATVKNKFIPNGAVVSVLMTRAQVGGPSTALLNGNAYGTAARVDKLVKSGPTSFQTTCLGTDGKTERVSVAELNIPKVAHVGAVSTTKNGYIGKDKSFVEFTSKVAGVTIGNLKIGAVESRATAWKTKDGSYHVSSDSKVLSIAANGKTYTIPNEPNQTLTIPGIAKITFNRTVQQARSVSVDALVIDVFSLNTQVVVAHSAAGIVG